MPPKDPRFLAMEPWEIELEFHTCNEYERAIAKAQGKELHSEEYFEVDEEAFQRDLEEMHKKTAALAEFNASEWEEIDGQR